MGARRTIQHWVVMASLPLLLRVGLGCAVVAGIEPANSKCADGVRDQDEAAIDCGGVCGGKCPGDPCASPAECASGSCSNKGLCLAPACNDKIWNGTEVDVDQCPAGQICFNAQCHDDPCLKLPSNCVNQSCRGCVMSSCQRDTDCFSGACKSGVCAVKN